MKILENVGEVKGRFEVLVPKVFIARYGSMIKTYCPKAGSTMPNRPGKLKENGAVLKR